MGGSILFLNILIYKVKCWNARKPGVSAEGLHFSAFHLYCVCVCVCVCVCDYDAYESVAFLDVRPQHQKISDHWSHYITVL